MDVTAKGRRTETRRPLLLPYSSAGHFSKSTSTRGTFIVKSGWTRAMPPAATNTGPDPPAPRNNVTPAAPSSIKSGTRLSTVLSGIALAVAVAALVLALVIPGPAGSSAPAPASSVTASSHVLSGSSNLGPTTCATWAGANVSIRIPAAGTIVVLAQVEVIVLHASGTTDNGQVTIDNATAGTAGCASSTHPVAFWEFDAAQATQEFTPSLSVQNTFHAAGAGTYTYAVFAIVESGASDALYSTDMIATYTPG